MYYHYFNQPLFWLKLLIIPNSNYLCLKRRAVGFICRGTISKLGCTLQYITTSIFSSYKTIMEIGSALRIGIFRKEGGGFSPIHCNASEARSLDKSPLPLKC